MTASSAAPRKSALFILLVDLPNGAERVTAGFASALAARPDWDVTVQVVCSRRSPSFADTLRAKGVTVRYGPYHRERISTPLFLLGLPRHRYDLVFSSLLHINGLLAAAARVGWLRTRRLVTRESNVFADRYHGLERKIRSLFLKAYGPQALIVVQTRKMGEALRPFLASGLRDRVLMIPNPTDIENVRRRAAEPLDPALAEVLDARPHIVWMGRLIDWKRPELAVEVLRRVREISGLDVGLAILGDGPMAGAVAAEVERHGLQDRVLTPGRQENPFNIARRCRVGLSTSLALEGFPNVLLEMMAAGVPSIVTTACADGLTEVPGLRVTEDFSAESLARAISVELASNQTHEAEFAANLDARRAANSLPVLLGESEMAAA